ncbi:hypothetical protein ACFP2T_24865 [Plantactinospora solaniradicis]|uniref:DUF3558 domain-containing protein n=1 Tax=Plantactinospora solaniradicis TaxID=1723736 RepID=A0ABW1KC92_9ACTN
MALAALVVAVTMVGCAGGPGAGGGSSGIPDEVMLSSDDLGGATISSGGPDGTHPLPPRPCASVTGPATPAASVTGQATPAASVTGPATPAASGPTTPAATGPSASPGSASDGPQPLAERTINATVGQYRIYEYVARYPAGLAQEAMDVLRDELSRCRRPAEGEDWKVLAEDDAGLLVLRSYSDGDATAAYYVGRAGEHLVAVLVIGTRMPNGDPTTASGLGSAALARAGGTRGTPVPPTTAAGPAVWSTYQAEVTGVRRGPDPRTLLIDVEMLAGHPECARNPRTDYYTEENGLIYANVVLDSARADARNGCLSKVPGVARLTSSTPIGNRVVVLNNEPWAPDGAGYRRCDPNLGCTPPADHCDSTWVLAAIKGMDVPRNSSRNVEACDGAWLVMTLNLNSTQCGAGGRPGCSAPPALYRYFMRFEEAGWRTILRTTAPGCADVLRVRADFPPALCRTLPAPG